ncbi:MAG: tetratricopeptide repeat protein [Polyangiaceae bacterium]
MNHLLDVLRAPARAVLQLLVAGAIGTVAAPAAAQESAVAPLREAAKRTPTDPAASLALGRALRRAGHFQEAANELGRGANLGAASRTGLVTQLRYELARTRIDERNLGAAVAVCTGIPSKGLVAACRAEAYLFQNRAAEALPEAQKALGLEAGLYEANVAEGRSLGLQGKVADAETALRAAISTADGRPEAHQHLGQLLAAQQGKRDLAIVELRKARAADAADPVIALALGEALLAAGNAREAREQLVAATQIRPTYAAAHAALAQVALEAGDVPAAEAAAAEATRLDKASFSAHVALGRVRIAQSRWDDAMKEGEAARKLLPNAAAGELIVADAHAGKGDIDLAVEAYQKAHGLDRTDPAALVRAARAATAAGRLTTAKGFADRATIDFPAWAPAWVELGDVQVKLGDKPRARSAYETALKSSGPSDRAAVTRTLAAARCRGERRFRRRGGQLAPSPRVLASPGWVANRES